MRNRLLIGSLFLISTLQAHETTRVTQFSNEQVHVWKTVIYPSAKQALKMHRHEYDRVMIALDDGLLKITNDKGKVHYLKFTKNKAYFLAKDVANELHRDENMTGHPIQVMIVELQNS